MHRKVAAALVAALALGIASCGGSETTTLSKAELVRQVEVACRDAQREVRRQMRDARGGGTAAFARALVASQGIVKDKLDSVTTSGEARADYVAFKDGVERRLDAIQQVASASRADLQRTIRAVQRKIEAASNKAQDAARNLGIDGCI